MQRKPSMTTKTLAYSAMLTALSVVLARLAGLMPNEFTRFSIEAVPIILSGLFFGPVVGGCVGFAADFIGCLFSPFGYNPIYCIPPILYGLCAGLFRYWVSAKPNPLRFGLAIAPAAIFGSIGIQSCVLAFMQYGTENFTKGLVFYLSARSVQFAIMLVVYTLLVWLLIRSKLFHRLGTWPPCARKDTKHDCN